jgi:hypothetical protein
VVPEEGDEATATRVVDVAALRQPELALRLDVPQSNADAPLGVVRVGCRAPRDHGRRRVQIPTRRTHQRVRVLKVRALRLFLHHEGDLTHAVLGVPRPPHEGPRRGVEARRRQIGDRAERGHERAHRAVDGAGKTDAVSAEHRVAARRQRSWLIELGHAGGQALALRQGAAIRRQRLRGVVVSHLAVVVGATADRQPHQQQTCSHSHR